MLRPTVLLLLSIPGRGSATPLDDALRRIEASRAGIETLEADFTQDKVMSLFAERVRLTGHLSLRRPGELRWEVDEPDASVFVLSGRGLRYRLPGARGDLDVRTAGALGVVLQDLVGFMAGPLAPLRARYRLELGAPPPTDRIVLFAVPLTAELRRAVSRIRLVFTPEGRTLESVTLEEPGGDRSEIRFTRTRLNQPLRAGVFTLP